MRYFYVLQHTTEINSRRRCILEYGFVSLFYQIFYFAIDNMVPGHTSIEPRSCRDQPWHSKQKYLLFLLVEWGTATSYNEVNWFVNSPNNPLRVCGSSCNNTEWSNWTVITKVCRNQSTSGPSLALFLPCIDKKKIQLFSFVCTKILCLLVMCAQNGDRQPTSLFMCVTVERADGTSVKPHLHKRA